MNIILSIGILIISGYILGELAGKISLPKISGYILAGILLNPDLLGFMSKDFVSHTDPLLTVSLSFITFSIGGSLSVSKLRSTGKTILFLTLSEALLAFIFVLVLIFVSLYFFFHVFDSTSAILAVSLVLASLAAPTDPSATLAVIHEYKAKGIVSSSMLEIAAFDDIVGIVIYSLATALGTFFMGDSDVKFSHQMLELSRDIGGALLIGGVVGFIFYLLVKLFKKQPEGTLVVLTFGLVLLSYGISEFFKFESLLSTMALGAVVINFNPLSDKIFKLIERYTDELIFVIFFTLSGLHLQLGSIKGSIVLILIFIVARAIGKFTGIYTGSLLFNTDPKVKKYAAGGLIPQGGIVIGLALLLTKEPAFKDSASMIVGIVIGAALIHEISGPILSRLSLKKAGELNE